MGELRLKQMHRKFMSMHTCVQGKIFEPGKDTWVSFGAAPAGGGWLVVSQLKGASKNQEANLKSPPSKKKKDERQPLQK